MSVLLSEPVATMTAIAIGCSMLAPGHKVLLVAMMDSNVDTTRAITAGGTTALRPTKDKVGVFAMSFSILLRFCLERIPKIFSA